MISRGAQVFRFLVLALYTTGVGLIYYKQSETVAMLGRNFVEYSELLAE